MSEKDFQRLSEDEAERIADSLAMSVTGDAPTPSVPLSGLPDADIRHLASLAALRNDVERDAVMAEIGTIAGESVASELSDETVSAAVESATAQLDYDDIVRDAVEGAVAGTSGGVDHTSTAIFKTQLQKGGRIAVPEAEIRALDLEPGDTLQVELFRVDGTE